MSNLKNDTVDQNRPFQGLKSFEEKNKSAFGGRDTEIKELFALVEDFGQTVVFGKSGIGKTSLLKAGLLPELRKNFYHPTYIRIDFSSSKTPLQQVKDVLSKSLTEMDPSLPPIGDSSLWEYMHDIDFMRGLVTPVLILDQFEEIFTVGANNSDVKELVTELSDLIENRIPATTKEQYKKQGKIIPSRYNKLSYRVVLSLREDYLARLEELKKYMPSIMDNRFRIVQMTISQAMEAAMKPAGKLLKEDVAKKIIKKLPGISQADFDALNLEAKEHQKLKVEPFLLSFICHQINEKRIEKELNEITPALVADFNISDVINAYYIKNTSKYGENVAQGLEDSLLTGGGFRKLEALDEMQKRHDISDSIIDELVDARVIRKETRDGVEYVELIHDVLVPIIKKRRDKRIVEEKEQQRVKVLNELRKKQGKRFAGIGLGMLAIIVAISVYVNNSIIKSELKQQTKILEGTVHANTLFNAARITADINPTISFLKAKEAVQFVALDTNALELSNFTSLVEFEEKLTRQYHFRPFYLKKIDLPSFVQQRHIYSSKTRKLENDNLLLFIRTQKYLLSKKININKEKDTSPWDTINKEVWSFKPFYLNTQIQVLYSDSTGIYKSNSSLENSQEISRRQALKKLRNIEHLGGTNFVGLSQYSQKIISFDIAQSNVRERQLASHTYIKFLKKISANEILYVAQSRGKPYLISMNAWNPSISVKLDLSTLEIDNVYNVKAFNVDKEQRKILIATNDKVYVLDLDEFHLPTAKKSDPIVTHHRQVINSIDSYKGQIILGSQDKTVSIFRDEEGVARYSFSKELIAHTANVLNVSFYDEGSIGITSGEDGIIYIWDLESIDKRSFDIEEYHGGRPIRLKFNPLNQRLYAGVSFKTHIGDSISQANYIMSFNSQLEQKSKDTLTTYIEPGSNTNYLSNFDFIDATNSIVSDLTSKRLALASKDITKIEVFSKIPGSNIVDLKIRGGRMAVAQQNKLLFYKNAEDPTPKESPPFRTERFNSVDIHPNQDLVLAGANDGRLYLWNLSDDSILTLEGHSDKVTDACFSKDGEFIASGAWDNKVIVWQKTNDATNPYKILETIDEHTNDINDVEISDSGIIASAGMGDDKRVLLHQIINDDSGTARIEHMTSLIRHNWGIRAIAFNEEDRLIYSVDGQGILKMWKYDEFDTIIEERTAKLEVQSIE